MEDFGGYTIDLSNVQDEGARNRYRAMFRHFARSRSGRFILSRLEAVEMRSHPVQPPYSVPVI